MNGQGQRLPPTDPSSVIDYEPNRDESALLLVQKDAHGAFNDRHSFVDQIPVDHMLHRGPRSGRFATETNTASDPDTMLNVVKEGDKRWPNAREVWGASSNCTNIGSDKSKQILTRINEKDASIFQCFVELENLT